jgi:site-specific DNA-methyltransferase (adenine-specific)
MLEHAIEATTFVGDIVLDCFAGSGSTALAAIKLGRRSVSLEIDRLWVSRIADRLQLDDMYNRAVDDDMSQIPVQPPLPRKPSPQLPLFPGAGK